MSPHKALDVYLRGDRVGELRGNGGAWGMDDDDARQTAASSLEKVAAAAAETTRLNPSASYPNSSRPRTY